MFGLIKTLMKLITMLFKLLIWLFGILVKIAGFICMPIMPLIDALMLRFGALDRDQQERRARAEKLARLALSELRRLGFETTPSRRKGKAKFIEFSSPLILTREELYCFIEHSSLPRGVVTNDLRDDDVIVSLRDRLGVQVREAMIHGRQAFVFRLHGSNFPAVLSYDRIIEAMPADAKPLMFPLGVDAAGKDQFFDIAKAPHLLIVGSTGRGKSVLLHNIVCTLLSRNSDKALRLWLADHKGGVELARYFKLPVVQKTSIEPETTLNMLISLLEEIERRSRLFREAGVVSIEEYEEATLEKMPYLVLVIDEILNLMLNKTKIGQQTIGKLAEGYLARAGSLGRAVGCHLVLATQRAAGDVLSPLITANFETRIVFSLADVHQSINALGRGLAVGMPTGRVYLRREGGEFDEIQTPLLSNPKTKIIIDRIRQHGIKGFERSELERFVDNAMLLIRVSCEQFGYEFSTNKIYQAEGVRGIIAKESVERIAKRLEEDGILVKSRGNKPRTVATAFRDVPELIRAKYIREQPEQPEQEPEAKPERKIQIEQLPELPALSDAEKLDSPASCVLDDQSYMDADRLLSFLTAPKTPAEPAPEPTEPAEPTEPEPPKRKRPAYRKKG